MLGNPEVRHVNDLGREVISDARLPIKEARRRSQRVADDRPRRPAVCGKQARNVFEHESRRPHDDQEAGDLAKEVAARRARSIVIPELRVILTRRPGEQHVARGRRNIDRADVPLDYVPPEIAAIGLACPTVVVVGPYHAYATVDSAPRSRPPAPENSDTAA